MTAPDTAGLPEPVAFLHSSDHFLLMRKPMSAAEWPVPLYTADQMRAATASLRAEVEALRKDAELWRHWLPYLRTLNRVPFNLAKTLAAIDRQEAP